MNAATSQPEESQQAHVFVRLGKGSSRIWHYLDINVSTPPNCDVVLKTTAEEPGSVVGLVSSICSDQGLLRAAAVLGVAPFCEPVSGIARVIPLPSVVKVAGLDIEQTTHLRGGAFPLPTDPLISIAIVTSDGRKLCRYSIGSVDEELLMKEDGSDVARVRDSTELADWALQWLLDDTPDFVAIHNGFKYDVSRLAAHCSRHYWHYFREANLGKTSRGYDLAIPGVTLVDTSHFLSKLHNADYESFALDNLAAGIGEEGKKQHPPMNVDPLDMMTDLTQMIRYNIHDSYLHIRVALATRCLEEIAMMCGVFRSPICDVTRFISGTLVCSMAASHALSLGRVLDWSAESDYIAGFRGAHVQEPACGYHESVSVADFASMYPSILIGSNLSCETVRVVTCDEEKARMMQEFQLSEPTAPDYLSIHWDDEKIIALTDGTLGIVSRRKPGIATDIMTTLIKLRKSRADKNDSIGWALKIGSNSYYGAFGSETSGLACKFAAALITAIGRKLVNDVMKHARSLRFEVIYGDTDSVFVKPMPSCAVTFSQLLESYHATTQGTPFATVKLEVDKIYTQLILLKPKLYYGRRASESKHVVDKKGMASKRRDRLDIARVTLDKVCEVICDKGPAESVATLAEVLYSAVISVIHMTVPPIACMKEVKIDSVIMLEYKARSGKMIRIEKSKFKGQVSDYPDAAYVITNIEAAVSSVLRVCRLPDFDKLIEIRQRQEPSLDGLL